MSNFTTQIRYLVEQNGREEIKKAFNSYSLADFLTNEQIETISNTGIWNKDKLADKIIDHYYFREIGFETWGNFKWHSIIYMKEIMEKYLPIIYSNAIKFDPLVNVDFTESFERESEGESSSNGSSNSNSNNNGSSNSKVSNTPITPANDISSGKYISNATFNESSNRITDNTNTESSSNAKNVEKYVRKTKGNSGVSATAQSLIKQYREIIYDVDRKIIEELDILFMGLYE